MIKINLTSKSQVYNFSKPYIIAEIGANHNGDMDLAKKMILSAKNCGADAAKFQSWTSDSLIAKEEYERNTKYDDGDGGKKHFGSLKEMVTKYQLSTQQHFELNEFCKKNNIQFCSTPFSIEEADLLNQLDMPFFKIASMDINNLRLLKHVAKFDKPIIISTGMSTLEEIKLALNTIEKEGNNRIILLHCISIYPPKNEDINLNNITMLQQKFVYPVGFSDHSIGTSIPLASIALGSCIIEKHFTLDRNMPGWDHDISANPEQMKIICDESKIIQKSLGRYERIVSKEEEIKKIRFRRSIVTRIPLKKGHVISKDDIVFKRPATQIPPDKEELVVGKVLKRDLPIDTLIKLSDIK